MLRTTRAACNVEDKDDASHIHEEDHDGEDGDMCPASCPATSTSPTSLLSPSPSRLSVPTIL